MSITERLANLSYLTVAIVVVALLILRFALRKQTSPVAKSVGETAESLAVAMALVYFIIRPFIVQAFFIPSESMVPTLLIDDHILVNKFIYRVGQPKRGDVIVFKAPKRATPDEKDFIKRVIAIPGDTVRITPGYVQVGQAAYHHEDLRRNIVAMRAGVDPSEVGTFQDARGRPFFIVKGSKIALPYVKLANGHVFVNGREIDNKDVAAAFGEPKAKVKVVPGVVYINGKPSNEPYISEDPDDSYPGGRGYVEPSWIVVDKHKNELVKIPKGRLLVMGDNRNFSNDARFWGLLDRKRVLGKAMFIFWPLNRIRWVR
jgi:signal peptidase I